MAETMKIDMRQNKNSAGVEAYVDVCGDVYFQLEEADSMGLDKIIIKDNFFGETIENLKNSFRLALV